MRVKDWVCGFVCRHVGRHPRDDWGEPADVEAVWLRGLLKLDPKPREDEADAASIAMVGAPLAFAEDHLPALLEHIRRTRALAAAVGRGVVPPSEATREAAEAASRGCPTCSGSGLATVYHPRYDGGPQVEVTDRHGEVRRVLARVAAHCSCPAGRWLRSRTEPEVARRIPCLVRTLEATDWSAEDPTNDLLEPAPWSSGRRSAVVVRVRDVLPMAEVEA